MASRAAEGARSWLAFLGRVVLFPLAWMWALRLARRHEEADPRGPSKVLGAIAVGLVLSGGVGFMLWDFQEDARDHMYQELDGRLATAVGAAAYDVQSDQVNATQDQIENIQRNLRTARDAGDEANITALEANLEEAQAALADHRRYVGELEQNQRFYERLRPVVLAQDDERAKRMIVRAQLDPEVPVDVWDGDLMLPRADRAFEINQAAQDDMRDVMVYLLFPGLIGLFYAPLFFALGSVLARAWEPSETVGYKAYPGKAMGWVLLLGGFGWPSLLLSAWGFQDIQVRSDEGQFSL